MATLTGAIIRPDLACLLFDLGGVRLDGPFWLKSHEGRPELPPSPLKIEIRNPPLPEEFIERLGSDLLYGFAFENRLQYDVVVGIPAAGEILARAFAKEARVPLVCLDKEVRDGKRRIFAGNRFMESVRQLQTSVGLRALLVDDVVARGDSKFEAIDWMRLFGFVVRDVLVCMDRGQGGRKRLAAAGCNLHAPWRLPRTLRFYEGVKRIDREKRIEILQYLRVERRT